jgi:hypothetical protein
MLEPTRDSNDSSSDTSSYESWTFVSDQDKKMATKRVSELLVDLDVATYDLSMDTESYGLCLRDHLVDSLSLGSLETVSTHTDIVDITEDDHLEVDLQGTTLEVMNEKSGGNFFANSDISEKTVHTSPHNNTGQVSKGVEPTSSTSSLRSNGICQQLCSLFGRWG